MNYNGFVLIFLMLFIDYITANLPNDEQVTKIKNCNSNNENIVNC